jgi:hypothetical protein
MLVENRQCPATYGSHPTTRKKKISNRNYFLLLWMTGFSGGHVTPEIFRVGLAWPAGVGGKLV